MEVLFGDDRSLTNLDFGWDYFKAIWSTLDRFTETPTAEFSMQLQIYQGAFQAEFALSVLGGYYGGVAVGFAERYLAARLTVAGTGAGGAILGSESGLFGWFRRVWSRIGSSRAIQRGFDSFRALKRYLGSPGAGKQWHHIVEQSQIGKSGFSPQQIHNARNIISIDKTTHQMITGHYNRILPFTNGLRVRDWLSGQSFEAQYKYGIEILKQFGIK